MSQEGSSDRLPSFKGPRDLTLTTPRGGGVTPAQPVPAPRAKRVFKPNIPPKRDPSKTASTNNESSAASKPPPSPSTPARGRGRGSGRGRGRGKEYIQTASIFSQGIGDPLAAAAAGRKSAVNSMRESTRSGVGRGGRSGGSGGGSRRSTQLTQEMLDDIIKVEYDDNDDPLLNIGEESYENRDLDFKSDPNTPVLLPLTKYVPELFANPKPLNTKEIAQPPDAPVTVGGVKIKAERKEPEVETPTPTPDIPSKAILIEPTSFAHVFASAPQEGSLFLLQLPDRLPVLEQSPEASNSRNQSQKLESKLSNDIKTLPEGYIGKIQILANGQTKFILGENVFDLEPGKPVGFRQDLLSLDMEQKRLIGLGPVTNKFTCVPDIDTLLRDIL